MIMFIDFVKEILSQVNLEEAISMFIFDKYIIILIIVYMYVFVNVRIFYFLNYHKL